MNSQILPFHETAETYPAFNQVSRSKAPTKNNIFFASTTGFINVNTSSGAGSVTSLFTGQRNISCYDGNDGAITVSASGGSGTGYEFSKENGNIGTWTTGAGNPYTFTGLSANVAYKIRAKDSNGCLSPVIPWFYC